jgi:hypothetical protein
MSTNKRENRSQVLGYISFGIYTLIAFFLLRSALKLDLPLPILALLSWYLFKAVDRLCALGMVLSISDHSRQDFLKSEIAKLLMRSHGVISEVMQEIFKRRG